MSLISDVNPVKANLRLYLEYFILAVLLAVAGLAVTLKMQTYRQEISITNLNTGLDKALDRVEVVEGVNQAQEKVIVTLANQREIDNKAVSDLLDTYQALKSTDQRLRGKLDELEKNDEKAKAYLATVLPESVACVYDDSCEDPPANRTDQVRKDGAPSTSPAPLLLAPEPKAQNATGGHGRLP